MSDLSTYPSEAAEREAAATPVDTRDYSSWEAEWLPTCSTPSSSAVDRDHRHRAGGGHPDEDDNPGL